MSWTPERVREASLEEVRQAARQQARTLPLGLVVVLAIGIGVLAIALFTLLDYRFDQDPHRIVKVLIGLAGFGAVVAQPLIGLTLLPIATPFLGWMPHLPIPGVNALNILLLAVFGVWAIGRVMRHETVMRKSRLGGIILVLLGLAALSIVRGAAFPTGYTYRAGEAAYNLVRSGMTFAIYFIGLAMVRGERMRRRMAWAIVLGLLAEAVVTGIYGRNGRGGRAIGSFDQSNELGAFLAMFSAFAAAMIPGTRRWFGKLVLAGAVAAGGFAVLLSVSRAAMIALVVSLLYVALRSSRLLLLVFLAALLTSPLWAPDFVKQRISGSTVETEDEQHLDAAAQVRIDTWHAILTVVTNHPLDGVGFTGLGNVLPEAGEALAIEVKDSAHNTYLRMLAEMGILGLVVFLVLLWGCLRMANEGVRQARTRFDRQLAVGFGAATLAMAVSCMFGDRFFSILITGNFWMLGALVNDALLETRGPVA